MPWARKSTFTVPLLGGLFPPKSPSNEKPTSHLIPALSEGHTEGTVGSLIYSTNGPFPFLLSYAHELIKSHMAPFSFCITIKSREPALFLTPRAAWEQCINGLPKTFHFVAAPACPLWTGTTSHPKLERLGASRLRSFCLFLFSIRSQVFSRFPRVR